MIKFTKLLKLLIVRYLFILLLATPATGTVPVLSYNSTPGTTSSFTTNGYIVVMTGNIVYFNVSADQAIPTWTWYIGSTNQNRNSWNFSQTWTTGGVRTVSVIATNAGGETTRKDWVVAVRGVFQSSQITAVNISSYTGLRAEFDADPNIITIVATGFSPYTNIMGDRFYLLAWGIIFIMMWIRQGSITIPSVLGLIVGAAVIGMMPDPYQGISKILIVFGVFALLYVFFRERR